MSPLASIMHKFARLIKDDHIEIYNEFSLQHELGGFLRQRMPEFKIRFERNVSYFFSSDLPFTKREIDISVFSTDKSDLRYAIELKYP